MNGHINEIEKEYNKILFLYCQNVNFAGLPETGEMFHKEILLSKIYYPLRITKLSNKSQKSSLRMLNPISEEQRVDRLIGYAACADENQVLLREIEKALDELIDDFDEGYIDSGFSNSKECCFQNARLDALKHEEDLRDKNVLMLQEIIAAIEGWDVNDSKRKLDNSSNVIEEMTGYKISRRIIESNPGQGKTTYLKRIALAYVDKDDEFLKKENLPCEAFPVFLNCNVFARQDGRDTSLLKYIKGIKDETDAFLVLAYDMLINTFKGFGEKISLDAFLALLDEKQNGLIFIIDAYDEIWNPTVRDEFSHILISYMKAHIADSMIISSRKVLEDELNRFDEIPYSENYVIEDLGMHEIEAFCRMWFTVICANDLEGESYADRTIKQIKENKYSSLKPMMSIPISLTYMLCTVLRKGGLPQSKIQLFDDYIDSCLTWKAKPENNYEDELITIAYLAYRMSRDNLRRVSENQLLQFFLDCQSDLDGILLTVPEEEKAFVYNSSLIKEYERKGILRICFSSAAANYFEFSHQQVQEYLTAFAITEHYHSIEDGETEQIICKHYKEKIWQEIIVLSELMTDRFSAENIINELLEEFGKDDDNYYTGNLLFRFVSEGVRCKSSIKHKIFDILFVERITDIQINVILEYMNDALISRDFCNYIGEKFINEVKSGESYYNFAMSVIYSKKCIMDNKNPIKEAEKLIASDDDIDVVLGLSMIGTICWCRSNEIHNELEKVDFSVMGEVFQARYQELLLSDKKIIVECAEQTIRDMAIADYPGYQLIFNEQVISRLVENISNRKTTQSVLEIAPINYFTMIEGYEASSEDVRKEYYQKYEQLKNAEDKDKDTITKMIFAFNICAILGCFVEDEAVLTSFMELDGMAFFYKKMEDEAKIRVEQLRKMIYSLSEPLNAGMDAYSAKDYLAAKNAFLYAWNSGGHIVKNNLAYMLRRKEIQSVTHKGKAYSVEELLRDGINNGDVHSLVNYALCVTIESNDIEKGYFILKNSFAEEKKMEYEKAYKWWHEVAESDDVEGYIVLYWINKLKIIQNKIDVWTIEDLKHKIEQYGIFRLQ